MATTQHNQETLKAPTVGTGNATRKRVQHNPRRKERTETEHDKKSSGSLVPSKDAPPAHSIAAVREAIEATFAKTDVTFGTVAQERMKSLQKLFMSEKDDTIAAALNAKKAGISARSENPQIRTRYQRLHDANVVYRAWKNANEAGREAMLDPKLGNWTNRVNFARELLSQVSQAKNEQKMRNEIVATITSLHPKMSATEVQKKADEVLASRIENANEEKQAEKAGKMTPEAEAKRIANRLLKGTKTTPARSPEWLREFAATLAKNVEKYIVDAATPVADGEKEDESVGKEEAEEV